MQATISSKYQVVIPKPVRERLNLKPQQKLTVIEKDRMLIFIPPTSIEELRGIAAGAKVDDYRDKSTGSTSSTRNVCTESPEIMAIASGVSMAEPLPIPRARGRSAKIAAKVVMAMGLMRFLPAWRRAFSCSMPPASRYLSSET